MKVMNIRFAQSYGVDTFLFIERVVFSGGPTNSICIFSIRPTFSFCRSLSNKNNSYCLSASSLNVLIDPKENKFCISNLL